MLDASLEKKSIASITCYILCKYGNTQVCTFSNIELSLFSCLCSCTNMIGDVTDTGLSIHQCGTSMLLDVYYCGQGKGFGLLLDVCMATGLSRNVLRRNTISPPHACKLLCDSQRIKASFWTHFAHWVPPDVSRLSHYLVATWSCDGSMWRP